MSTELQHTEPSKVTEIWVTMAPRGRSASGYGGKIPTRYKLRYEGRMHRVYMMQYANSGSPYIVDRGVIRHIDLDTEYRIEQVRDAHDLLPAGHYNLRVQPRDFQGRSFHASNADVDLEIPDTILMAWAHFQLEYRILGLTVFRRWLRIFHPNLTVNVYTR